MDTFQNNIKTAFDNILNGTENIKYDNTTSGLESTTVKEAIDELAEGTNASASDVTYDKTASGLTSENVQGAIDESIGKIIKNNNGTAIKFSNGFMICIKSVTFNDVEFQHQEGNLYFCSLRQLGDMPATFKENPIILPTCTTANGLIVGVSYYSNSSFGQIQLYRGNNTKQATITVKLVAVGEWK
jgi:hypothetical protein